MKTLEDFVANNSWLIVFMILISFIFSVLYLLVSLINSRKMKELKNVKKSLIEEKEKMAMIYIFQNYGYDGNYGIAVVIATSFMEAKELLVAYKGESYYLHDEYTVRRYLVKEYTLKHPHESHVVSVVHGSG